MPKLKKFFKVVSVILLCTCMLVAGIYSVAWHLVAKNMQAHIDYYWSLLPIQKGIVIVGDKPEISGFPFPPEAHFSGVVTMSFDIYMGNSEPLVFEIPDLKFVGFPLTGLTIYLEAPQGLGISEQISGRGLRLDYALINATLPKNIPEKFVYREVKKWQETQDYLIFNHIFFQTGEVRISGDGVLGLNSDLQPDLRLQTRITGMDALFEKLSKDTAIKQRDLDISKSFLKLIAETDPETGELYFETGFFIQNNNMFIGPMRIGTIPPLEWIGSPDSINDLSRKNLGPE
ncbi:MAG: DUF2125 domain-containing protein [Pseudobdellovibrionaceae bacterium]|nr:DUF2125 domain-containing protein [Pseudobdellovibrionaceae bacterium]